MQLPGYQIIRKINQGGMSSVYLAVQLSVGREVALKVMAPALNSDPVFSERFQREANIVGQLSHPHIVSIYDIGRHRNLNYIAMDYLAGGSVQEKMAQGISPDEALRITREVALALDHAHEKGYIHRDIKPENILFREDGSSVLTDFGVAKALSQASRATHAGTVVGTPHYMSPEQTRGRPVDGRSDIYSLGVVLYEMLTGQVPFQAEESVAIAIKHLTAPIPKLPVHLRSYQNLIDRLLAKDPEDRFQRGRELVSAIDELRSADEGSGSLASHVTGQTAVSSLSRALLVILFQNLRERLQQLIGWISRLRWTPRRGLYRQHTGSGLWRIRPAEHTTIISRSVEPPEPGVPHSRLRAVKWLTPLILIGLALGLMTWFAPPESDREAPQTAPTLSQAIKNTGALLDSSAEIGETAPPRLDELPEAPEQKPQASEPAQSPAPVAEKASEPPGTAVHTPSPPRAGQPAAERHALTVEPSPETARVRIMNIVERYYPGIPLKPGRYRIETSQPGYYTDERWVRVADEPLTLSVQLEEKPTPGATFTNRLPDGAEGPEMVIVPAGRFTMGSELENHTQPLTEVRISNAYAISAHEITFADYARYAQAEGLEMPSDSGWGGGVRPVINLSWHQAQGYVDWLKETTGKPYRLPSEAEWEYAARGGTDSTFWWGSAGADARGFANCRRGCDSPYTGFFSSKTAPVGAFPNNPYGLYDTSGNVAEWVQDCYRPDLSMVPEDGSAFEAENCAARSVRGGSFRDSIGNAASHVRTGLPPETKDSNLGFRVVVELY